MTDWVLCEEPRCQLCGFDMPFVNSHYQCDNPDCPIRGQNQLPCCQP